MLPKLRNPWSHSPKMLSLANFELLSLSLFLSLSFSLSLSLYIYIYIYISPSICVKC